MGDTPTLSPSPGAPTSPLAAVPSWPPAEPTLPGWVGWSGEYLFEEAFHLGLGCAWLITHKYQLTEKSGLWEEKWMLEREATS